MCCKCREWDYAAFSITPKLHDWDPENYSGWRDTRLSLHFTEWGLRMFTEYEQFMHIYLIWEWFTHNILIDGISEVYTLLLIDVVSIDVYLYACILCKSL